MSVLIKNMEMPSICDGCDFCDIDYSNYRKLCRRLFEDIPWEFGQNGTLPDCPIVEIPPHGDLTDKDKLMQEFMDSDLDHLQRDDWREVIQIVADAPTVIEAEGSETDA